jgi:hypothetical protein
MIGTKIPVRRTRKFSIGATRRYNSGVITLRSKPSGKQSPTQRVLSREAVGVVIIAIVILAITLARYWHNIAWSAR